MDLAELVKSVAALTNTVGGMKGAMDSMAEEVKELKEKKDGMDEDDEEAKKKAAEEAEAKKKEGEGMDAKLAALSAESAALKAEIAALKAKPAAMDSAAMMAEIAKKNDLAARVSAHIGTFAHDSMDHAQVAQYAAEKLGLDKAHAVIAVESYLKARPAASHAYGMDAGDAGKSTGLAFLAEQLK